MPKAENSHLSMISKLKEEFSFKLDRLIDLLREEQHDLECPGKISFGILLGTNS